MDWQRAGAAEIGRAIEAGRADPVDIAGLFLDAAACHPDGARIYARLTPERARAEAEAARIRARLGARRGPLDGVPVSWKDLFDTAGTGTEGGTPYLRGRVPEHDAELVARGAEAGLVCLGKTHMTEIAFSGLGLNPATATPPNIHDPAWLPGGSSSGAAASVAFGLAPGAIGSDTGGSVRLPAAWNGLVGFKPPWGALPLRGALPLCPGFDTAGPLARSVEDAALLWEALGGPRVDLRGASAAGLRLGVPRQVVCDDLEEAPARAFEAALARLGAAGARIATVDLPALPACYPAGAILYAAEAWASWRAVVEPDPSRMFPPVLERLLAGADTEAAAFLAARAALEEARRDSVEVLAGLDAVLCPASPILPPDREAVAADYALFRTRNLQALRNTRMANLLGLASVALPLPEAGCGLLLSAPRAEALLRTARAAERVLS
ncbi:amidase [Rubellimicrobium sp. CFH 75288]|uniref:amidase n=1 Tax=Rubellimicrobium sp. CFH 75288 TaxID=2697034 RepID=UPI00141373B5|nr:amidase family protein [Rubellimicrobium sp. CFH 75288]NAZ37651.1 amidase [Rubellimicrobium sp. CFH 75288]